MPSNPTPLSAEKKELMRGFVFGEVGVSRRGWTWNEREQEWEHESLLSGDEYYARSSQLATDVLDLLSEVDRLTAELASAREAARREGIEEAANKCKREAAILRVNLIPGASEFDAGISMFEIAAETILAMLPSPSKGEEA